MTTHPPGRRRQLWTLYAAGFVTAFGAHAVAANLAGYGRGHHTSMVELGVLLALYDGAEVLLKPVFGTLADRIGAKAVILGGLIGFAAVSALFVVAADPGLLGAARFGQGAAAAAFSPAAGAMVAALGGRRNRGRAFGGYGGAKGLGYLAGPVVGGALVRVGGYNVLFAALAALAAVVAVLVAIVPPVPVEGRSRETLAGLARRLRSPAFVHPVVILGAGTAALSAGVGFLPVMGARAHLDPFATGAVVSLLAATAAVVQPRVGARLDAPGGNSTRQARFAILVAATGFGVGALAAGPVALVGAAVLIGAGVGASTPIGFSLLADGAPAGRLGQTMGAGEVGRELGDAGGPLLVGAVAGASLGAGFALLGAALVVAAASCRKVGPPPGAGDPPRATARAG